MPTISSLLSTAYEQAKAKLELLIMLGVLSGIFTSFLYRSAGRKINEVLETLGQQTGDDTDMEAITSLVSEHSGSIILGYIGLLLATSILLPLWARAVAPSSPIALSGGLNALFIRAFQAFWAVIVAAILTSFIVVAVISLVALIAPSLGGAGRFMILLAALAVLWLSLYFMSAAHIVICFRSLDKGLSFRGAFILMKLFIRPVVGSLAVIWLVFSLINLLVGNLVAVNLSGDWGLSLALVVNGLCMFLTSAAHVGAVYSLPGIKEVT